MDSRYHEQQLEKPQHMEVEDPVEVKKKKKLFLLYFKKAFCLL